MRVAGLIAMVLLLGGGTTMHAQTEESLDAAATAAVLTRAFAARAVLRDSARISACSLRRVIGEERMRVDLLPAWVRARLVGDGSVDCAGAERLDAGRDPVWSLRHVFVETGTKVIVRAILVSPSYAHHEAFVVRRDHGPGEQPWYVDEIILSEFVHADLPPLPPSPP